MSSSFVQIFEQLDKFPQLKLAHLPTPLTPLLNLRQAIDRGPLIWLKRDDCTGLALGGNKTRKLEFLLGDARARETDVLITFGALQSNHARQTAAAAAVHGFACELILTKRVNYDGQGYDRSGNLLLDNLFGANVLIADNESEAQDIMRQRLAEHSSEGRKVYLIPTGGSSPVGALGYVYCLAEIRQQAAEQGIRIDAIAHATSSGGTQAGLLAGCEFASYQTPVMGINVSASDDEQQADDIAQLAGQTLELMDAGSHLPRERVWINSDYRGEDYGIPTPLMQEAVEAVAQ
ncbi:MAG: D-cysteine desulfhydrase family protein, partial [Pseudomonadota bacterium]